VALLVRRNPEHRIVSAWGKPLLTVVSPTVESAKGSLETMNLCTKDCVAAESLIPPEISTGRGQHGSSQLNEAKINFRWAKMAGCGT
jgi:hypothetical protein